MNVPRRGQVVAFYGVESSAQLTDPAFMHVADVDADGWAILVPMPRMDAPPDLPERVPYSDEPSLGHWTWPRPRTPEPDPT